MRTYILACLMGGLGLPPVSPAGEGIASSAGDSDSGHFAALLPDAPVSRLAGEFDWADAGQDSTEGALTALPTAGLAPFEPSFVPEPATLVVLALGGAVVAWSRRRRPPP